MGGGDSALQEGLTLAATASQVIVLEREAELTAQDSYRSRVLEHPKIEVRYRTEVEEILGEDAVAGVRTRDLDGGETGELELGAVFVYVGLQPNSEPFERHLSLDDEGRIPADASMRTELPGLFAAGGVRSGAAQQAAASAGDGAAAAKAAARRLDGAAWPERVSVGAGTGNAA